MTNEAILAIIFIITLLLAAVIRFGLKNKLAAKLTLGAAALLLALTAYLLHSTTVPPWLLVLSGLFILLDAYISKKRA